MLCKCVLGTLCRMIRQIYSLGFPGLCQRKLEETRLYGLRYEDVGECSHRNEILVCLRRLTIISPLLRNLHMFIKMLTYHNVRRRWRIFNIAWYSIITISDVILKTAKLKYTTACGNNKYYFLEIIIFFTILK